MATTTQAQIHVKSYFATSVPAAIDLARRELGPDALLLNSREAPPEARHLGAIEVVFGHDSERPGASTAAVEAAPEAPHGSRDGRRPAAERGKDLEPVGPDTAVRVARSQDGRQRLVEQALIDAGLTAELATGD